jgi:hypothetical protein
MVFAAHLQPSMHFQLLVSLAGYERRHLKKYARLRLNFVD